VNNLLLINSDVSFSNISDYPEGLFFLESTLFPNMLLQISILAKLCHDVYIVLSHENLDSLEDVRM